THKRADGTIGRATRLHGGLLHHAIHRHRVAFLHHHRHAILLLDHAIHHHHVAVRHCHILVHRHRLTIFHHHHFAVLHHDHVLLHVHYGSPPFVRGLVSAFR